MSIRSTAGNCRTWLHCALTVSMLLSVSGGVVSADLYRWFKLDEGEGEVATDSSPNGEHGEIFDATWVEDPDRGTVLEFDGEVSWVEAGYIPLMDLENDFTWAFWENQADFQASPANDIIIGNRGGDGGPDTSPREFIKFTANRFEYHMDGGHANDMPYGADDPEYIPSDGEWRHHVVVKDGDQLSYYRDAEFFNEHELLDPMFSEDPLPFGLGGQGGLGAGEFWAGLLSDVRLYDQALTPDEVGIVFAGGDPLGPADPLAPLNDGSLTDPQERLNYVHDVLNTWMGDSNVDGEFNSSDLVLVFGAAEYEDTTPLNSRWETGDWNGDMEFNSSDLVAAFSDGGYEIGPRPAVAAVPEPASLSLVALGAIGLLGCVRRRQCE